jgi:hypothetical protein
MGTWEHKRPSAELTMGNFGRFVVGTRRGRVLASVCLAAAALLGLVLGVLHVSNTVSAVTFFVFGLIMAPVVLPIQRHWS